MESDKQTQLPELDAFFQVRGKKAKPEPIVAMYEGETYEQAVERVARFKARAAAEAAKGAA